jgi:hypothetical protein
VTVLLRVIAVWAAVVGLRYATIAWTITSTAVLRSGFVRHPIAGPLLFALEWTISIAGLFGAVHLWRLREGGRRTVLGLAVLLFLIPVIGVQVGVGSDGALIGYGINVLVLCVLLSKRARVLCAATRVPVSHAKAEVGGGAA